MRITSSARESRIATVRHWTRTEIRALRAARRMSVREFAAHLGVSGRIVSRWEAGARPRPVNQAALDTSLALSDPQTQERFALLLEDSVDSQC